MTPVELPMCMSMYLCIYVTISSSPPSFDFNFMKCSGSPAITLRKQKHTIEKNAKILSEQVYLIETTW